MLLKIRESSFVIFSLNLSTSSLVVAAPPCCLIYSNISFTSPSLPVGPEYSSEEFKTLFFARCSISCEELKGATSENGAGDLFALEVEVVSGGEFVAFPNLLGAPAAPERPVQVGTDISALKIRLLAVQFTFLSHS